MDLDERVDRGPLAGQAAIVTGASRGIGRSIAVALGRAGADVSLVARSVPQLAEVCEEIAALGRNAEAFAADVSDEAQVRGLVLDSIERWGRLDIIVNNAGIGIYGPLAGFRTVDWDRLMAVNARGAFLVCREAMPFLLRQERAYIVNISSVVGVKGYANQAAYSASKHAMMGMTKALARELHGTGVRVHAICPGGTDTAMAGSARPDLDRSILIRPEEVADVVLFLVTRRGNAVIDAIHIRRAASTPWA